MARRVRKNRSVRYHDAEWVEIERAAAHLSARRSDPVDAGTAARELSLAEARRINRAAEKAQAA